MQTQSIEQARFAVLRRDGHVVAFDSEKIRHAIAMAFLCDASGKPRRAEGLTPSSSDRAKIDDYTTKVVAAVTRRRDPLSTISVEEIQDQVELALMRAGEHEVARDYVIYRQARAEARGRPETGAERTVVLKRATGNVVLTATDIAAIVSESCVSLDGASAEAIAHQCVRDLPDEVTEGQVAKAVLLASRALIERDPAYDQVTAHLLLQAIRSEVLGSELSDAQMAGLYPQQFVETIELGLQANRLDRRLALFDLTRLGGALRSERDRSFKYMGLQVLLDRYFMRLDDRCIELPQSFFMRIAMGLAINEEDMNERAIEFYELLSSFRYMSSTPTLFNAGTVIPQLSSCYLTTIPDDLDGIYSALRDNALLQKFAGGLGNDWTRVRSLGSVIKGTNGKSQGIVPFLKVASDTAVAVNQGGKRKGAVSAYLETWHLDIEEFLELRKNAGDDRRRTHDMNTAHWIPDLFMRRVVENATWTLFSPVDVPDLHGMYGQAFEHAYLDYEARAAQGQISHFKEVPAVSLWRKMLSMLFETGHPWLCFKDACNVRSPQQHVGVVHGSNLCTEITLNTSDDEIAVCNLGSVNLAAHVVDGRLDQAALRVTVRTAMRMLDNVIDLNHYAVIQARRSNLNHRPVGLGMMGLQDALYQLRIPFASQEALDFGSQATEALCFFAYEASSDLAAERGSYPTFQGSLWSQGLLPPDTVDLLRQARGGHLDQPVNPTLEWDLLRAKVISQGMRNSNCVAVAPTATIAGIIGVVSSIEPAFRNLYVKSNLSGEFTAVNEYLIRDLKLEGLWDDVMLGDLKYFDGSVQAIDRVPQRLKDLYATAIEIDPKWVISAASRRQVWIDQAQSVNVWVASPSGKALDETYKLAWAQGLKTTYYLRTVGATSAEKSTSRYGALNAVSAVALAAEVQDGPRACSLDNPECEACQ